MATHDNAETPLSPLGSQEFFSESHRLGNLLRQHQIGSSQLQRLAEIGTWQWIIATDTSIWSEGVFHIFGLDPDMPPPSHEETFQIYTAESATRAKAAVEKSLLTGEAFEIDLEFNHPDGKTRWITRRSEAVCDAAGQIFKFQGIIQDITKRKRIELALRASEERWKLALENAGDGLWDWDVSTGKVLYSRRWKEMLGYAEEEVGGEYGEWLKRLHPDEQPAALASLKNYFKGETESYINESRMLHKDGSWRWILARGMITSRDADGHPLRLIGTHTDVTERRQAHEMLRQRELELREAQRVASVGSWAWEVAVDRVIWSEQLYNIFGRDPKSSPPNYKEHPKIYTAESWARLDVVVRQTLQTGAAYELDLELIRPDGAHRWIIARGEVERDVHGQISKLRGTAQDITERKRGEDELRWKTAFLEANINSSLDGILVVDNQGRKIFQNQLVKSLWKIPPAIADSADDGDQLRFVAQQVRDSGQFVRKIKHLYDHPEERSHDEVELINGTILERYSSPVIGIDGTNYGRIWVFRDITERRKTQARLQELAIIVENTHDAIASSTLEGIVVSWNHAAERIFGYSAGEMIGCSAAVLFPPDDQAELTEILVKVHQGSIIEYHETIRQKKDGTKVELAMTISPIKDKTGRVVGSSAISRDITEQKRLERLVLEISAKEQQRIGHDLHDGLGQYLAGIAFKTKALEYALVEENSAQAIEAGKIVALVNTANGQARALARGLDPVEVDGGGILQALKNLAMETGDLFRMNCGFSSNVEVLAIDGEKSTVLYRVVQESIHNALVHGLAKKIKIEMLAEAGQLQLRISDDGKGFPIEPKPRSGIGLRIMQFRASSVGGRLTVQSQQGCGTEVVCRLPLKA